MSLPIVNTISFSAMSNWQYCPHYYRLVNIEKLKPFENTVFTHWGRLIHKYLQEVLLENIKPLEGAEKLKKTWVRFCRLHKQKAEIASWANSGSRAVLHIQNDFKSEFGNYKVLKVEERLTQPIPEAEKFPQRFKGFIDIVLELEDGRIIIADFKSCSSNFIFNKYRDKYKDYQLTLYKYFWGEKHDFQEFSKNIETYFVTIEREGSSKKPTSFVRVTSGPKKVENALEWLSVALSCINDQRLLKKRMSCHKYSKPGVDDDRTCVFYKTKHCS